MTIDLRPIPKLYGRYSIDVHGNVYSHLTNKFLKSCIHPTTERTCFSLSFGKRPVVYDQADLVQMVWGCNPVVEGEEATTIRPVYDDWEGVLTLRYRKLVSETDKAICVSLSLNDPNKKKRFIYKQWVPKSGIETMDDDLVVIKEWLATRIIEEQIALLKQPNEAMELIFAPCLVK